MSEAGAGQIRRRFIAPLRGQVDAACFRHPVFDGYADQRDLLAGSAWPAIEVLSARLPSPDHRFVAQDATLLADGLHYESRIAQGRIATRPENWHDLLNALVWMRYPAIKRTLNARQCLHIQQMGARTRSPAQQALTQFDETGVIVRVRDPALLAAWDRHDWAALFACDAWQRGDIAVAAVIGHALMEQMLVPGRLLVGKCLVVQGNEDAAAVAQVGEAIAAGRVLAAASDLRPLPLAGIPGWHPLQDAAFMARVEYFRPVREGRCYPPALAGGT